MGHSTSVYHVSGAGLGTTPRSFKSGSYFGRPEPGFETGYSRNNSSNHPDPYRRSRSNSSGCFLERLDLETPTPPPPPSMLLNSNSNSKSSTFFREKPKYKYNGFMPTKHGSAATDYTSAGSPPITPVPTPPPPPPLTSAKTYKHFEYKPTHVL